MSDNQEMTVEIHFDPTENKLRYEYSGCGLLNAIGLLEMAKLHAFNDILEREQEEARS